jgi:hypothetical protein
VRLHRGKVLLHADSPVSDSRWGDIQGFDVEPMGLLAGAMDSVSATPRGIFMPMRYDFCEFVESAYATPNDYP